jgi:hypothetical protein
MYDQARIKHDLAKFQHDCAVRFLCNLRHKKGLTWFRQYISKYKFNEQLLGDFYDQWKLGNKGEWGCWKKSLSQQQGLGI